MSLASTIRNGVQLADRMTKDLQVQVRRIRVTTGSDGGETARATKSYQAIWEDRTRRFVDATSGIERTSRAKVTILKDADVLVNDLLERVGSDSGPVLQVDKMGDPKGGGYLTIAWVGSTSVGGQGSGG